MADSVNDGFSHDQVNHQTNPTPTLASLTSAQTHAQEQMLEAGPTVSAVLGITELLLLIVAAVPLDRRASIRRVSKTWQAAVNKIGYVLEPAGYTLDSPSYLAESQLKPNHFSGLALKMQWSFIMIPGQSGPGFPCLKEDRLGLYNAKKLYMHQREFITNPPITHVTMCGPGAPVSAGVASLRVPEGIRVGDLLECLKKLDPFLSRYQLHKKYYVRFAWQLRGTYEDE
jgi:hypothetical protein